MVELRTFTLTDIDSGNIHLNIYVFKIEFFPWANCVINPWFVLFMFRCAEECHELNMQSGLGMFGFCFVIF